MNDYLVFGLGFLAQSLFFGRTFLQWFKSENEGVVFSPVLYWKISLVASLLMLFYGILRNDFAILLGQAVVYYIYVRNLHFKRAWRTLSPFLRIFVLGAPIVTAIGLLLGETYSFRTLLGNREVAPWLLALGVAGQLTFTFGFVYQWFHSERVQESQLPPGFWIISITGALIILVYAFFRRDPVLLLSNSLGLFIYLRNVLIHAGFRGLLDRPGLRGIRQLSRNISNRIR